MRICLIVECLGGFGGLEEIVTELAIALRERGHATSVVSTIWVQRDSQYKKKLRDHGVAFVEWPVTPLVALAAWALAMLPALVRERSWAQALAAKRDWERRMCNHTAWRFQISRFNPSWTRRLLALWSRLWRPDVLHIHNYVHELNLTHILEWTQHSGIPTVFEEHQTPQPEGTRWEEFRRRINKATAVGAVSKKAADVLRQCLGVERPIFVLPPIVHDPGDSTKRPAGRVGVPRTKAVVTTIARFIPEKGLPHLFEAISSLRESYPGFRFRLWGDGPFPDYNARMRETASGFGLDPEEVFAGTYERRDLAEIFTESDIFVLPSLNEGVPLTVVEAMAFGCPIVATTAGGIPDVLRHEENALLCSPGDAGQLEAALRRLLENPEERARLAEAARRDYETGDCHPDHACREYLAMYTSTLRDSGSEGRGR